MVAGGTESPVCRIGIAGFCASRALSTGFNDNAERASRPYDKDRDGFVMGEGAGIVVLEEFEHAKARGAKIYAEVIGYGLSGDAYHITAPSPDGDGGIPQHDQALEARRHFPADIDYINAHGTSTPLGDEIELGAVERLLGNAAGRSLDVLDQIVRSAICSAPPARSRRSSASWRFATTVAPPTINLDNPSVETPIDLVPHTRAQARDRYRRCRIPSVSAAPTRP